MHDTTTIPENCNVVGNFHEHINTNTTKIGIAIPQHTNLSAKQLEIAFALLAQKLAEQKLCHGSKINLDIRLEVFDCAQTIEKQCPHCTKTVQTFTTSKKEKIEVYFPSDYGLETNTDIKWKTIDQTSDVLNTTKHKIKCGEDISNNSEVIILTVT